jgi:hypothetical protein
MHSWLSHYFRTDVLVADQFTIKKGMVIENAVFKLTDSILKSKSNTPLGVELNGIFLSCMEYDWYIGIW